MNKEDIRGLAADFVRDSKLNVVDGDIALRPDIAGMRLFEEPLVRCAAASDPFFGELLRPEVIGSHFRLPGDWLSGAQTVVSLFFPFTDVILRSNRPDLEWPSQEWLHGRIEGQKLILALCARLVEALSLEGYAAVTPAAHPDFWKCSRRRRREEEGGGGPGFTSNWSERHVAHVAGLGTFGLSAGLITEKGMAGRFGSVVTTLKVEPDPRPYARFDEYCSYCGACIPRCTFGAISLEGRKDHVICGEISARNKKKFHPRYGCGKCQVRVPCERGIPKKRIVGKQ